MRITIVALGIAALLAIAWLVLALLSPTSQGLRTTTDFTPAQGQPSRNPAVTLPPGSPPQDWGPLVVVPPQPGADTARTEGKLRVTDRCVFLSTRGGDVLLLWPADRTTWDAHARTITFSNNDGSTVIAGDGTTVVLGGSGDSKQESGTTTEVWMERVPWVARPAPACPVESRWWVGALTR